MVSKTICVGSIPTWITKNKVMEIYEKIRELSRERYEFLEKQEKSWNEEKLDYIIRNEAGMKNER